MESFNCFLNLTIQIYRRIFNNSLFLQAILKGNVMPTYEYKCSNCSYTFEIFQSIKAEPIKVCPKCNGEVKRLIGPGAGPIFKGSGFYQTDYKNSGNTSAKKSPEGKSKPTESKTSTESKTQSRTDKN